MVTMKRINPKWLKVIQDTANPCPYFELQNIILKEITWGNALLEIQIEDMLSRKGIP